MQRAPRERDGATPRWLALGIAAAGVALVGLFLAAGFPAERLAPRVRNDLAAASGAQVGLASLETGLSWGGPVLIARDVSLRWPDGTALAFERVAIRPAWSLGWLRGAPVWHLDVEGNAGGFRGTLGSGERPHVAGGLRAVALERLPAAWTGGAQLSGRADADLDVALGDDGWDGTVDVRGSDGSFAIPALPIGVPFQQVEAQLVLGGEGLATLESLVLEGPMIAGRASGTVGASPQIARAPLQIELEVEVRDPNLRPLVQQQGLALDAEGRARLRLGGTLGEPAAFPPPRAGSRRR